MKSKQPILASTLLLLLPLLVTSFTPPVGSKVNLSLQSVSLHSSKQQVDDAYHALIDDALVTFEDNDRREGQNKHSFFANLANPNGNAAQQFMHNFLAAGGGDIGERGEVYFFAQALFIVAIAAGGIPMVSDVLKVVTGTVLMLVGVFIMALTSLDMGEALTPWPKPNGEGLVTCGLYGQVRHPMYSGLLSSLVGFSIWTGSVDRLILVALLYLAIDVKSDYEEAQLAQAYPNYPEYKEKVKSKFFPKIILNLWKNG